MRTSVNPRLAAVIAILIVTLGVSVPAMCAEQPKWSISGDSLFKVYWQTTLRVANETNLAAGGMLGPDPLDLLSSLRRDGLQLCLGQTVRVTNGRRHRIAVINPDA